VITKSGKKLEKARKLEENVHKVDKKQTSWKSKRHLKKKKESKAEDHP
jgi:hypothetical protein